MMRSESEIHNKRLCQCGCGELIDKVDIRGIERFYKKGHSHRGLISWNTGKTGVYSEETIRKMSEAAKGRVSWNKGKKCPSASVETRARISQALKGKQAGSDNHGWKGDNAGEIALRAYINKHKPKPVDGLCEMCHVKSCTQAVCLSEVSNRDFNNWQFLCVGCKNRRVFAGKECPHSPESIAKMSQTKKELFARGLLVSRGLSGPDNPGWLDDKVRWEGLLCYVRRNKPKPIDGQCEICHVKPCEEVVCVTEMRNRDFNNWKYLCLRCKYRHYFGDVESRRCCKCGGKTRKHTVSGYLVWYVVDRDQGLFQCHDCYVWERRHRQKVRRGLVDGRRGLVY